MRPKFCEYCGTSLDEGCNCARELAEYQAEFLEELENRPETQLGYMQQDLIDLYKFER